MPMEVTKRVLKCYVETILTRDYDSWTISKQEIQSSFTDVVLEKSVKNSMHS